MTMIRNTALAEAFVSAAAVALNNSGNGKPKAPWMARRVVERVTYTPTGTIREADFHVNASYRTRQTIAKTCEVRV